MDSLWLVGARHKRVPLKLIGRVSAADNCPLDSERVGLDLSDKYIHHFIIPVSPPTLLGAWCGRSRPRPHTM
eukprot:2220930-Prymnesium_polylepis.1